VWDSGVWVGGVESAGPGRAGGEKEVTWLFSALLPERVDARLGALRAPPLPLPPPPGRNKSATRQIARKRGDDGRPLRASLRRNFAEKRTAFMCREI